MNTDNETNEKTTTNGEGSDEATCSACNGCREPDKCSIMGRCLDQDERQHNLQKAIISSILSIETTSVDFLRQYPDILDHYNRSLKRYLEPSSKLVAVENASEGAHLLAKNPTVHNNAFGTTYRYMRYLTLRSRIKAIQQGEYGRLSRLTIPEGDLSVRIESDRKQIFVNWLENPDKLIYDDTLNKS